MLNARRRTIKSAEVRKEAVFGCACHVAAKLIGIIADKGEERDGLFHHHVPCLASTERITN
jgi:hypothetical protein